MNEKISVPEIYGMNVFNDAMMREHLPKKVYEELKSTIEQGAMLNSEIADYILELSRLCDEYSRNLLEFHK